jgi:L-ascorbate metabolism protein UlaG (beta-lactamase superfamily)
MEHIHLKFTYIGGPTAIIELGGMRLLTDPTFDPAGTEYKTLVYTLKKTIGPALGPESLGHIDAVLLSHDHHFDNLDNAGRDLLEKAGTVLTTHAGAGRLGGNSVGLSAWESTDLNTPEGRILRVTGTPAQHGTAEHERGPVTGFALDLADDPENTVYFSGDTIWYEGVEEVSRRFSVRIALLSMGAARVPEVGPDHLTCTAKEAVETARAFGEALIIPLHYEGWEHFSESRMDIVEEFDTAGLENRLRWMEPGRETEIIY